MLKWAKKTLIHSIMGTKILCSTNFVVFLFFAVSQNFVLF
jgi:hypothetical protein